MLILAVAYLLPISALFFMTFLLVKGAFYKRTDIRYFVFFLITLIIWLALLWATDWINHPDYSPLLLKLALFVGSFSPLLFFVFAQEFTGKLRKKVLVLASLVASFFAVSALGGWLIKEIAPGDLGIKIVDYTVLYTLQSLYTFLLFALSVTWIILKARRRNALAKKQASSIAIGATLAVLVGIFGGGVVSQSSGSNLLSPLAVTIFATGTFIAVFKHGLFSIRLIVARSIAYISSLAVLVTVVAFLSAVFINDFLEGSYIARVVADAVLIVIAVLTYPYLKRFFDRVTNSIFYRDAYDPQVFLNQLNNTIVGNIELGILIRHTVKVIEENLKADCYVSVKETDDNSRRTMGTAQLRLSQEELEFIGVEAATIGQKIILTDRLEDHYRDLRELLSKNNISVLVRLVTNYQDSEEATAYLFLGPKKSGNTYDRQDLRIINIISDELLIAIQNALRFEEIQAFNITLQKRINDATAKLKRSNEKLKEMDETKDEFISMASHQLRTPLTSVKGYLSMVLDGDAGKITPTQKELLNQAFVSSQRMVYLIADLLNVSRLKTGKFIIEKVPTNLAEMVESEIAQLKEVAKSRKLDLVFDKPKDFPVLLIDETKTRQVVMNFVDNAIYYTPAGGHVKIDLKTDRHSVYFMVKDDGLGVPKEDQAHLFTKFYRAKNAQKARPDGTGLGLFMAKKVINEQGGSILFESVEGKGSTFGFKFDLPKDGDAQPETLTDET